MENYDYEKEKKNYLRKRKITKIIVIIIAMMMAAGYLAGLK